MSLQTWLENDPEQRQHRQFCPICAGLIAARRERVKALIDDPNETTTEEGPA